MSLREKERNIVSCRRPRHGRQKVCFAWDNLEAARQDHPRTATVAADPRLGTGKSVYRRSSVLISVKRRTLLTLWLCTYVHIWSYTYQLNIHLLPHCKHYSTKLIEPDKLCQHKFLLHYVAHKMNPHLF